MPDNDLERRLAVIESEFGLATALLDLKPKVCSTTANRCDKSLSLSGILISPF